MLAVILNYTVRAAVGAFMLARVTALHASLPPDVALTAGHEFAYATLAALLWLVPPALTAPSSSLMWGGGQYLAVSCAVVGTAALTALLAVLVAAGLAHGVALSSLGFFAAVAAMGCVAPGAAAAWARARAPVAAKKHAKSWRWLAAPALWAMAFVAGNLAAPPGIAYG